MVTSWNCRDLTTGAFYLDPHHQWWFRCCSAFRTPVMALYELYKLGKLNPNYKGLGKVESRLTETSDSCSRGCGRVRILKSFAMSGIATVRLNLWHQILRRQLATMKYGFPSLVYVHLSSITFGVDLYRDALIEFERVVFQIQRSGGS